MNENQEIDSELSKIPKKNPFTVPENYFEDFPINVQEKIESETKAVNKRTLIAKLSPYFAIAASFIIVVLTWFTIIKFTESNTNNEISNVDYIEDYSIYTLDETELIEYLADESNFSDDETYSDIETDELIEYLVDKDDDTENLIYELE